MNAPYADDPGNSGIPRLTQEKLNAMAIERAKAGFQLGFHAIGDRAVGMALDAFALAEEAAKGPPRIPMSEEELEEAINEIYGRPKGWRLEQFSQPRNDDKAETFNIQHSTPNIEEVSREEREVGAEVVAEGQQRIGDSQSSSLRGPCGGPAVEGAAEEGVAGEVAGVRDAEDGRAKAVLMGREQVGLPGRVWVSREGPCGRPPGEG